MGTQLVTGANGGIGTQVMARLRQQGHSVIPVTRHPTGEGYHGDLALMQEVNRVADTALSEQSQLDALILNAGVALRERTMTSEGFEATFAVNHLGPFLLAHRLLPLLRSGDSGRIVLTGSSDHMAVRQADLVALAGGERYRLTAAYAASKAVAMAAMMEMSNRLGNDVLVNIADPGWTRTGLHREAPFPLRLLIRLGGRMQNTPEESARVISHLATETNRSGQWYGLKGPSRNSKLLDDHAFLSSMYDETVGLLVDGGYADSSIFLTAN